jgi:hypothetical protein
MEEVILVRMRRFIGLTDGDEIFAPGKDRWLR